MFKRERNMGQFNYRKIVKIILEYFAILILYFLFSSLFSTIGNNKLSLGYPIFYYCFEIEGDYQYGTNVGYLFLNLLIVLLVFIFFRLFLRLK